MRATFNEKAVAKAEEYLKDKGDILYVNIANCSQSPRWLNHWFIITSEYVLLYPITTIPLYWVNSEKISNIYFFKGRYNKVFDYSTIKIDGIPKFTINDPLAIYDTCYNSRAYIEIEAILRECKAPI